MSLPSPAGEWPRRDRCRPRCDLRLGDEYINRIESLRDVIEVYDRQIHDCDVRIHRRLKGQPGYEAIQALRGVGPVLAAVFVAEIGDVTRFDNPQ